MAIAVYATDLTTVTEASGIVNWDESSDALWDDAGSMVDETNFYIQNGACVSAQFTKDGVGTIIFIDGTSRTIPANGAVLFWHYWASPPSLSTLALGGIRAIIGNSLGAFKAWDVSGSDFEPAPLGGWWNFAVDPTITADDTVGSVSSPYTAFGMAVSATAQARGNPNAVDVMRFGRCDARYSGGDLANGYATFDGFALEDNDDLNKWALLMNFGGGLRWQGLMTFGFGSAVDFRDANKNITVANTLKVQSVFNKIEVRQATSNVEWTAISISALGTVSKGAFEAIDDATIKMTSCTFTDMNTFIFKTKSTIKATTFRRCSDVTIGGGTFTDCVFDATLASYALTFTTATEFGLASGLVFNNYTGKHAIYIPASVTGTITLNNFKGDASGTDVYWAGTAGTLIINKSNGTNFTTWSSAGGTVSLVTSVSIAVNVKDEGGVNISGALVYVDEDLGAVGSIINTTTDANGDVSTSYSGVASVATIRVRKYGFKPNVATVSLGSDSSTNITLISDPQQV